MTTDLTIPRRRSEVSRSPALDPSLLVHIPGLLAVIGPEGRSLFLAESFGGRSRDAAGAHAGTPRFLSLFLADDRPRLAEALEAARCGQSAMVSAHLRDAGAQRWLRLAPGGEGRTLCLDATAEHDALAPPMEDRMREVDHRMKNSLATISSLIRIQARAARSDDTRHALQAAALRVLTVGQVHEQLHRSRIAGDSEVALASYLHPLIADLVGSLSDGEVHLLCELEPVYVTSAQAIGIGLIVTELVMNSLRHAVGPGTAGGMLHVRQRAVEPGVRIVVDDGGPGLPPPDPAVGAGGIGTRIMELYTRSLGATLAASRAPTGGARFTLDVPL